MCKDLAGGPPSVCMSSMSVKLPLLNVINSLNLFEIVLLKIFFILFEEMICFSSIRNYSKLFFFLKGVCVSLAFSK